jgi:hypothetical protein
MKLAWIAAAFVLAFPVALPAQVTVKGKTYPASLTVEGKALKLVGAGVRKKWGFSVYSMGVYTESGACDAAQVVDVDEVKYLKLDFLRDVTAEKFRGTIDESFEKHTPAGASDELKNQRATFVASLTEDLAENSSIELTYVPGRGTTAKQKGKQVGGAYAGRGFQKWLWDIYFGPKTCCEGLKEGIFESCAPK